MELLFDRAKTNFYRGQWEGRKVLYKVMKNEYPSPSELAGFYNEYSILQGLDAPGVRTVLGKERLKGRYALVLEYLEGDNLNSFKLGQNLDLDEFYRIALALTQVLARIHQRQIIHKDVKPGNVIYQKDSKQLFLIDFGLASRFEFQRQTLGDPERLKGTLAYISPEQTGRMNRGVDNRSDLYSLGAAFYYLLTGRPPFDSANPAELIHSLITKEPTHPSSLNATVPEPLAAVVLKLLKKNAEDRYLTAEGLLADLEQARNLGQQNAAAFVLGYHDHANFLKIPNKLFGREEEISRLLHTFQSACSGTREMVLVDGSSGTGKSSLVQELFHPITLKNGIFVSGKFDQLQRDLPFYALTQALTQFAEFVLAEEQRRYLYWQNRIQGDLGDLGQILVELVPALAPLVGATQPVPQLEGVEAYNRLEYVFRSFIECISAKAHPFVLFLDDLQWADLASIKLIQSLMVDSNAQHFLLICCYRQNEVGPGHPFFKALEEIETTHLSLSRFHLKNLKEQDVRQLCSESLRTEAETVAPLAQLVTEKTGGNAFFVCEFLRTLERQSLLAYNVAAKTWVWNLEGIRQHQATDNLIDLLTKNIQLLPPTTQRMMQFAACIGERFNLQELAIIAQTNPQKVAVALEPAVVKGMLLPESDDFRLVLGPEGRNYELPLTIRFAHDRLLESTLSFLSAADQAETHLSIARLMRERLSEEEQEKQIFKIVNHYAGALALLPEAEQTDVAALLLRAGKRAQHSAAYDAAWRYFAKARECLSAAHWQSHYPLCNELFAGLVEAAYLSKRFEEVPRLSQEHLQQARSHQEGMTTRLVLVMTAVAQNHLAEALAEGLAALKILGVSFPANPKPPHIIKALLETKLALRKLSSIEAIADLPPMTDEGKILAMSFIQKMTPAAFRCGSNLFPLLVFKQVSLSLKYGNCPISLFGYAAYGISLAGVLGDLDGGYRFGKMALNAISKVKGGETYRPHVLFVHNNFLCHWKEPIDQTLDDFMLGYQPALENGFLFEAAWLAHGQAAWGLFAGRPLEKVKRQLLAAEPALRADQPAYLMSLLLQQVIANLQGSSETATLLRGPFYDEGQGITHEKTEQSFYLLKRLLLLLLFEQWEQAHEVLLASEQAIEGFTAMPAVPLLHFYGALIRLTLYRQGNKNGSLLKKAKQSLAKLRLWARHVPKTHQHRVLLIEAELARAGGKTAAARGLYEQAILEVRKHNHPLEEGLVGERAADFYRGLGDGLFIAPLVQLALAAYFRWGATAKVTRLQEVYSPFLSWVERDSTLMATATSTSSSGNESSNLDLKTVIEASQAISQEIKLDKLLTRMMKALVMVAGASRAYLIFVRKGRFFAESFFDESLGQEAQILNSKPIEACDDIALTVVHSVWRSQKNVVLDDAQTSVKFGNDPHVQQNGVKSLLCLLIHSHAEVSAILYMENNLSRGAFQAGQLEMLSILSAQTAISIENALLYQNMENQVAERTLALKNALEEVLDKNFKIQSSIAYASNIQRSLLPSKQRLEEVIPNSFVIWDPRDGVGGDIYLVETSHQGAYVMVLDCTGHGVPGGFLTMIVASALKQLIQGGEITDPALLLQNLNRVIQSSLYQKGKHSASDDGLDGGICFIPQGGTEMLFAGAHFSLFVLRDNLVHEIKGDRQSVGYQSGSLDYHYHNHAIALLPGNQYYLSSDGLFDQSNEQQRGTFGKSKFRHALLAAKHSPMSDQRTALWNAFVQYQGQAPRRDDVTVIGFQVPQPAQP